MKTILCILMWLLLAPFDLLVNLLAFPLAPVIVLLTTQAGVSPLWCWPWLTDDNPIDGDAGHLERWPDNGTRWRVYSRRVAWLWRNRGYGFSTRITGVQLSGATRFWGDRKVSDNPMHAGWCIAINGRAWELYAFYPWLSILRRGLRIRIGWAIPLTIDQPAETAMLKTHVNPFKGYTL
ncbi:hypothetical protein [uncultured Aquitalea sp.]|uniref:DUF7338 family protein n=1 Tax=uncultured Aquitalea sp. TaxID=540272 RepID=UPI0025E6EA22|nr:hypothetical protein [uncultured Aquitalea sp.]